MKILLINNYYYKRGGSEVHFLALEELLKSHGHEVTIFSTQNYNNIKNENFWPKYNDKKLKNILKYFYNFEAKRCVKKLLENNEFDICHIHNINFHLTYSIISEIKKKNIKIVMTTHDYSIISPNYNLYRKWNIFNLKNIVLTKEYILRKLFFSFNKNINQFICPSEFIKNKLSEDGFKNLNVIYNFSDIKNYNLSTKSENYFLYFGRLSKEKGLLEFVKTLKKIEPNFLFYIVGDGEEREEIEKLINKLNLQNNIKLLGYKSGHELSEIISKSKFVVLPTLCEEVCNMSIIESICLKMPVLTPNLGGNTELSKYSSNVFIYNIESEEELVDKINHLRYNNMLTTNKQTNIFNPENYYEKLASIYNRLKGK